MKSCKVPGDDGLTKKVYETFWYELKTPLLESINLSTLNKTLSISNRQAVIPFIEKKDWQKRYIKDTKSVQNEKQNHYFSIFTFSSYFLQNLYIFF